VVATLVTSSMETLWPSTVSEGVWLPKVVAVTTPVCVVPDRSFHGLAVAVAHGVQALHPACDQRRVPGRQP